MVAMVISKLTGKSISGLKIFPETSPRTYGWPNIQWISDLIYALISIFLLQGSWCWGTFFIHVLVVCGSTTTNVTAIHRKLFAQSPKADMSVLIYAVINIVIMQRSSFWGIFFISVGHIYCHNIVKIQREWFARGAQSDF